MKKLIFALLLLASNAFAQFPNLLTGQTPRSFSTPAGWTVTATENFENGNCGSTYCNGIFNSTQFHNDGNPADTHSIGCTYGNYSGGTLPCNGSVNWNKALPAGTRQVYVSWYEYIDSSFRMNDEMFLARFHWDTGNGQPAFREAILDYFQNSSGTYNSTDATWLWNIQGQPYYQNRLPSNQRNDLTNFTITTGSFVQWELYMQFSTVSPTITLPGTVTMNATAHTYTRSSGSWIADGVKVGDAPHFTGFVNSWNNAQGEQGGGGSSYFVTAVTDTVMTVTADCCNSTSNETASNVTLQVDHGDGAYALYKNGSLVAYQTNMVSPGKYDFSTSNTTLSIGESYSKLIWRAHVGSGCETQAPFTASCATGIGGAISGGGCGFEQIPFGWNASGLTKSVAGGTYNTPIDCSAAASGPMPNPPVFNRYIDDIIVLTQAQTATVSPVTVTASSDSSANYQTVTFPGYAKFTLGDGMLSCGASALPACTSAQGLLGYWDLKNDPSALYNFGAADAGMFEHQWGIKNQDGSLRYDEIKEGPMPITVTESNNVRVKLTQSGAVRAFGNLSNSADCCMTMTKSYVFYRHGGSTVGAGASKVYTNTTINYNNADGKAPLTTAGTSTGINYYNKIGWWHVSGETNNQTNPCPSPGSLGTFTLSPWNLIYPGTQGTTLNKNYILYAPVNANDSNSNEFIPANPCVSGTGAPTGPEGAIGQPSPGTIYLCNGATSTACVSQSPSPAIVKANFLQIEQEQQCSFMSVGTQNYFLGGLRTYCALASQTFPANTPRSWLSAGFIGDNNIISDASASSYVTEYKTPPTITFTSGSGGTFDPSEGYWTMTAVNNSVSFVSSGLLHSPAFFVSSFGASVPTQITIGSTAYALNIGYVGVKTDSTHLLIQPLIDIPSGTQVSITGAGGTLTISPKTATIPVLGSQQFSAAGATFSVSPGCTGSVNATSGVYTASSTAETCTITATAGTLTDFATVTSQALTVAPTSTLLTVGGTQTFTANFPVTWSVTPGGGTIDSAGRYVAPQLNGTYTVTATAVNGGKTATASVTVTGQQTFLPLSTSPTRWTTSTQINVSTSQVFTVSNVGTGSVTPTVGLSAPTQFSITGNTCGGAILGGGNCSVTVRFLSSSIGTFTGTLLITDSAGGSQSIALAGTAVGTGTFLISPATATIPVNSQIQLSANQPAYYTTNSGVIDSTGLFTAPATPSTSTVTGTQYVPIITNLQALSGWKTCGNCGDSGGPNGQPNGTFTFVPGNPATFSAQGNYPFNNGFWYYVLGSPGDFNTTTDYMLSFDMQFPTQADKNASQAVEFELQQNVLDHQYSMAWQICFACGNKLRVFNKTQHFWEDTGLTFDPAIFAGGKWVTVLTTYKLTIGSNTRHLAIALNGVNHVVNIDHAPTPAVEGDYLHPAFQLDSNGQNPPTPYSVKVRNFNVGTYTSTTTTAAITSINSNKVSPSTVNLPTSGVQVFNSQVSSSWTVGCGTFTGSGTTISYTAPASPATCTIQAVGGGVTGTATANVSALQVTPLSVTLQTNSTQQFTANFPATWAITSGSCTITQAGVLTAPTTNGTCIVRATAQNGGTTATASVSVVGAATQAPGSMVVGGSVTGVTIH